MNKGASSNAAKTAAVAVAGAGSPKEQHKQVMTEREEQKAARRAAQQAFLEELCASCKLCMDMEEQDVVEEYRPAGKLHTYDPDKEVQKRIARVAKLYPYPWPKKIVPMIEQYMMFLEEDEDDYRIGLYSFLV